MKTRYLAALFLAASPLLAGCVVHTRPAPPPQTVEPADADYNGWEKLGERIVNGSNDRDSLLVGRAEGRFAAIRIRVTESDMKMQNVVVVFADGTTFSPETRLVFEKGAISRVIDLPGTRRAISRIDFRYTDLGGARRAHVEVWAR